MNLSCLRIGFPMLNNGIFTNTSIPCFWPCNISGLVFKLNQSLSISVLVFGSSLCAKIIIFYRISNFYRYCRSLSLHPNLTFHPILVKFKSILLHSIESIEKSLILHMVIVDHINTSEHGMQIENFWRKVLDNWVFFEGWTEVVVSVFFFYDFDWRRIIDLRDHALLAGIDWGMGEGNEIILLLSMGLPLGEDVLLLDEDQGVLWERVLGIDILGLWTLRETHGFGFIMVATVRWVDHVLVWRGDERGAALLILV